MSGESEPVLGALPAGSTAVICGVNAGRALGARLAAMGLFPGVRVKVLRNARPGPLVILVHGSRIMLGRGMARQVRVRQTGAA